MSDSPKYKTIAPRFAALFIDGLLISAFIFFESFLVAKQNSQTLAIGGLILSAFCISFYSFYLHGVYGQTIGKIFAKVKVLDVNEEPINFYISFLRELPYILFSIVIVILDSYEILTTGVRENFGETALHNVAYVMVFSWLAAEIIVMLSNDKRRSIHDYIAGTVVVNLRNSNL